MSEEYEQTRYEDHVKERGQLLQLLASLSDRYDKWAITLSGGAVGVSLAFIEKIAPNPLPWSVWLAGVSWLLLVLSLLAAFLSLLSAVYAAKRQVDLLDESYEQFCKAGRDPKFRREKNRCNDWTHRLNLVHSIAFPLGVLVLCVFAFVNLRATAAAIAKPSIISKP
jgi:hypothetical protein